MSQTSAAAPAPDQTGETAAALLRGRHNEWLLVVFTALTNMADAIARVALPLLTVQLTGEPGLVALVGVLITLPWLLTSLHIGVLVDRANRRTLMVYAELARLLSVGLVLLAVAGGFTSLPLIYVVAVMLGVAQVVALTSGASIVPAAVARNRWQPANARITAMEYLWNAFLGAPIGGFLVAVGFVLAFGTTGVVYVVGIVMLSMLAGNFAARAGEAGAAAPRQSVHADIREGLQFLWRNRLLRTMALLIAVMAGSWSAWLALLPAYAAAPGPLGLRPVEYGFLLTCLGAGGVAGTILVGPVNRWMGRRWSMFMDIVGSFVLVAAPAVLPGVRSSAVLVGAAAFVAGAGGTMWTVNYRVIIQALVPNELLGRANSAYRLLSWGAAPVAAGVGGLLAQFVSFRVAFGFFALACLVLIYPYLRVVTDQALAVVDRILSEDATSSPRPSGAGAQ